MKRTGKYSLHALIDEIREEEDKQMALSRQWPAGDERREWHRAVSTGLNIAADIVEGFMFRQREDRLKKEGRL